MTPEEYFAKNPDAAILAYDAEEHYTEIFGYDYRFGRDRDVEEIDWTGYDRCIAYNPDFKWGKKREIEWGPWLLREPGSKPSPGDDVIEMQAVSLPDGWTAYRYGDYVDTPVKFTGKRTCKWCGKSMPVASLDHHELCCYHNTYQAEWEEILKCLIKPKLSRFLPEGWKWEKDADGRWFATCGWNRHKTIPISGSPEEQWNHYGLLPPSEGGGFQQHNPGDPMPCDGDLNVDVVWPYGCEMTTNKAKVWNDVEDGWAIYPISAEGWRPAFQQIEAE